jgi:hypothetical protein
MVAEPTTPPPLTLRDLLTWVEGQRSGEVDRELHERILADLEGENGQIIQLLDQSDTIRNLIGHSKWTASVRQGELRGPLREAKAKIGGWLGDAAFRLSGREAAAQREADDAIGREVDHWLKEPPPNFEEGEKADNPEEDARFPDKFTRKDIRQDQPPGKPDRPR